MKIPTNRYERFIREYGKAFGWTEEQIQAAIKRGPNKLVLKLTGLED